MANNYSIADQGHIVPRTVTVRCPAVFFAAVRCVAAILLAIILAGGTVATATARDPVVEVAGVEFVFASPEEGKKVLGASDDFLTRLSPFDLQSRVQTSEDVTMDQYREFVAAEIVPWKEQQAERLTSVLRSLDAPLSAYELGGTPIIQLIQSTGREESGAAYTRSNAIVLTRAQLSMSDAGLRKLVLHELFHVLSRADSARRDRLYAIIGFTPSDEILLPEAWRSRRITNPDAPVFQHVITIRIDQEETIQAAPVLFAKSDYDPQLAKSMFAYLKFGLMQVQPGDQAGQYIPALSAGEPIIHPDTNPDFRRQIGANTGYIIHPEEILADNFAAMVLETPDLPDPWIIDKMREIMARP
jgi:hypothetical protein